MGRAPAGGRGLPRDQRADPRAGQNPARAGHGGAGVRCGRGLPLRIPGAGAACRGDDRRGADRVRDRRRGRVRERGVVDPGRRVEPLRISLPPHAGRRGRHGAHADHLPPQGRWPAYRDPRGGAGRLFGLLAPADRGAALPHAAGAVLCAVEGARHRALRDPVAGDPHRRGRAGALRRIRPHPQPQRAQPAGRCRLGAAPQICRHLVGDASRPVELERRAEAWRHHRARAALHRFRRRARLRLGAGGRLEQGLVERERAQFPLRRGLSRFRHGPGRRPCRRQGRRDHGAPRDRRQCRAVRAAARRGARLLPAPRGACGENRLRRRCGHGPARGCRRHRAMGMARRPVHGAPSRAGRPRSGGAADRHQRARADQGHRPAPDLPQPGHPRRRPRDRIQRLGRTAQPAGPRTDAAVHPDAVRPARPDARHRQPGRPQRAADPQHPRAPAGRLRGDLFALADGGRPARELCEAPRRARLHRAGAGRLGANPRAGGRDRRLCGGRAPAARGTGLVDRRRH